MATMHAVVTTGVGGYDRLEYREVPVPTPGADELLVRVLAAGVNNTDLNTRVGWYSSSVSGSTEDAGEADGPRTDGGWGGATPFPLIQGTDCCGVVETPGELAGRRVLVRPCMRTRGFGSLDTQWLGSDRDGAFAQYVAVPASEVFPVDCDWTDVELASLPCAYGTAENLLHRAAVGPGDRVLITGASGGVGSAAVQLAVRRGATVVAVCSAAKADAVRAIGADRVLARDEDLGEALGARAVDVAVDTVGGPGFGDVLRVLRRGGRYATSGAIAGAVVQLDLRTAYLNDLTLIGATAWDEPVFGELIRAVEAHELRPLVAGTFPLADIVAAQQAFAAKKHVGKLVLVPPTP
ncbi:zinc-binding dehydrogenase [Isoptericola sp. b441]|uniref:Zinc-binding dehydrogenase n=1 Tax=Actinotalea lenta TaxID=3064654 RepID=A0ABT9DB61_9CELL|nr:MULTISPECIES: zinc-binding dehydrogenase [unclassified Isoptericola]MDO8108137.1 zinc-binding dehydrogenase [Isoptericola sp. b441]MDO8120193.1 zinc-binding dehydrogenase [Isoptericola sp. b490]